jgi:anaphase-promoting complex subunit 3
MERPTPAHSSLSFSAPDSEPHLRNATHAIPEEDHHQQLPLSRLLTLVGDAHRHRCCFRLAECEACIRQLPRSHFNTAWAQNTLGLAYFHHHQYKAALKYFAVGHKADPCRLQGAEFHSTVMWILKMEHDLAALAQHCLSVSRLRPESWCVVGNCFSLNRECDSAIKYFQRAVMCDPSFAYAYTLAGHEHHQNDDFECALQCFRGALKCQPRHYQAWYGLGMVFQKQERLSSAE